jgi:hypothetical protein
LLFTGQRFVSWMHLTASIETCRDQPRKQPGIVVWLNSFLTVPVLRDSFSEDRASNALSQCHHGIVHQAE